MSEEKPVLKVTDRRLFNPDGTPRDIGREESTTATTTPNATGDATKPASSANSSQANPISSTAAAATSPIDTGSASPLAAATAGVAPTPSSSQTARTTPAENERPKAATKSVAEPTAEDPTAFVNLLMFIASPAAAALGLTEHPGIGADEIDLPLAKHCIDLLGTLRQKTKGNVTGQEDEIFENLLAELRMQFVSLSGARGSAVSGGGVRGGFSGSDITGGR